MTARSLAATPPEAPCLNRIQCKPSASASPVPTPAWVAVRNARSEHGRYVRYNHAPTNRPLDRRGVLLGLPSNAVKIVGPVVDVQCGGCQVLVTGLLKAAIFRHSEMCGIDREGSRRRDSRRVRRSSSPILSVAIVSTGRNVSCMLDQPEHLFWCR